MKYLGVCLLFSLQAHAGLLPNLERIVDGYLLKVAHFGISAEIPLLGLQLLARYMAGTRKQTGPIEEAAVIAIVIATKVVEENPPSVKDLLGSVKLSPYSGFESEFLWSLRHCILTPPPAQELDMLRNAIEDGLMRNAERIRQEEEMAREALLKAEEDARQALIKAQEEAREARLEGIPQLIDIWRIPGDITELEKEIIRHASENAAFINYDVRVLAAAIHYIAGQREENTDITDDILGITAVDETALKACSAWLETSLGDIAK